MISSHVYQKLYFAPPRITEPAEKSPFVPPALKINKTKQESRRYAKRQMTWFKNSFISDLLHTNLYRDNDELVDNTIKAFNLLSNRKC